ncbi:MAG: bifunctional YncE family protein/alkaline phosphatase family protein [Vulcanimicrobiaceae bacterium]
MASPAFWTIVALGLLVPSASGATATNASALASPVTIRAANRATYTHQLPTGREVAPVGTIVGTPNFPTAIARVGPFIAVLANGSTRTQTITLYDTATLAERASIVAFPKRSHGSNAPALLVLGHQDFFQGLAAGRNGTLYAAGGNADDVLAIATAGESPKLLRRYTLAGQRFPRTQYPYTYAGTRVDGKRLFYPDALAFGPHAKHLFVAGLLSNSLARIDLATGAVRYLNVGAYPNALALADGGRRLIVSLWGENAVALADTTSFRSLGRISLGPVTGPNDSAPGIHPIALLADPHSARAFVALANADRVAEIDVATRRVIRLLDVAPYRGARFGSNPDALALSGGRLFVADAGNDDIAVFDVRTGALLGRIPAGWYPTALAAASGALYAVSAKGFGVGPNLRHQWIGDMMGGLVQRIALPIAHGVLARFTTDALAQNRFLPAERTRQAMRNASLTASLRRNIHTVVLILRENKTFDENFGTYPGLGHWADPHLALYGARELPNLYALAHHGALFANFDADGEVTAQGHQWTTAASDSDFVQRTWQANYSGRGLVANPGWTDPLAPTKPGADPDNPYADAQNLFTLGAWSNPWISYPAGRFLFDDLAAQHVSFENFGEFIARDERGQLLPALSANTLERFPGWDRMLLDTGRARIADAWITAHAQHLPHFLYIWLPDDHTAGGSPCYYTPDAYVANNDAATGQVIAALSHTPAWRHMAIFVTEDDAQSGADHIDAHRTFAVAAGPWVKPGVVQTSPYSQVDVIRTIEAILGVPPLSQWDQNARVIGSIWGSSPNDAPFTVRKTLVPLAVNPGACPLATRLRREAGEGGQLLTPAWLQSHGHRSAAAPRAPSDAFTPTTLLKVSGDEQMRQEWIATRGQASYARVQAYLLHLAASRHAPLRAFLSGGD